MSIGFIILLDSNGMPESTTKPALPIRVTLADAKI